MYRRNRWGPGRPWRHIGWFFWVLPFIFYNSYHSWWSVMTGMITALFITLLIWGIMSSFGRGSYGNSSWMGQTWNQPPQTPSQATPTYQAYDPGLTDESYQSYARGYRGENPAPAARPSSPAPVQEHPQYDEPQMEYPREEPPLVQ